LNEFYLKNGILELTNSCNNNCIICQDKEIKQKINKNWNEIKNTIDYFKANDIKEIIIYGGEPLINKNFKKTIGYLRNKNFKITICSNGRIFSSNELCSFLKNETIITSIYSKNEDIHDKITGVEGSLKQTLKGIKNLIEKNITVKCTIVITKLNVNQIYETIKYLSKIGINEFKISGLINLGKMKENHYLIPEISQVKDEIKKITKLDKKIYFEKLPICLIPEEKLIKEPQHKDKILIKPDQIYCLKCKEIEKCR